MTVIATDDFNRADSGTLGANWSSLESDVFAIVSNQAEPADNAFDCEDYWNADAFPDDQYSEAELYGLIDTASGVGVGPMVRGSPTGSNYWYAAVCDDDNAYIRKCVNGSVSSIGTRTSQGNADGDVSRLEVSGTSLSYWLNGTQQGSSITDSDVGSGSAGIAYSSQLNAYGQLDNWEAGSLDVGGVRIAGPQLLSASAATLFTAGATGAIIQLIQVTNESGSSVDLTFSIGTDAAGTRVFDGFPIAANDTRFFRVYIPLDNTEIIQAYASTGSVLAITVDGIQGGLS